MSSDNFFLPNTPQYSMVSCKLTSQANNLSLEPLPLCVFNGERHRVTSVGFMCDNSLSEPGTLHKP